MILPLAAAKHGWHQPQALPNRSFDCGYCGNRVASTQGLKLGAHSDGSGAMVGSLYICTNCKGPNYFFGDNRYPGVPFGNSVTHTPEELASLYDEARRSTAHGCYTGAVLLCRKMLMNIGVNQGAAEGLKFIEYVNHLASKGFIPPNGRQWVDHIRNKGNEATHEIALMSEQDAKELILFTEMLLKFIYEFPSMIPKAPPSP